MKEASSSQPTASHLPLVALALHIYGSIAESLSNATNGGKHQASRSAVHPVFELNCWKPCMNGSIKHVALSSPAGSSDALMKLVSSIHLRERTDVLRIDAAS